MFIQLFVLGTILVSTSATVASNHPCNRQCTVGNRMTCVFNFTVENYYVLSRACYQCPLTYDDCFRPQCISTNGMPRHVLTVNRQLPGPSIEVCKGDTVEVWVNNMIDDGMATAIHWHGLIQNHTNFMDGVPRLTQCNIQPFETFRYRFTADNAGTHWWHSHTGMQLGDGLHGAFIVREPDSMEPLLSLYDHDLSDHIMVINDWPERPQIYRYMEEMQHRWVTPKRIQALVNGRGRYFEVSQNYINGGDASIKDYTPYEVFTVSQNMRYRFRVIGATTRCYFRVMVDQHQLVVVSSDGVPFKPAVVQSFMIHPGERYDFVLTANQTAGDYWIKLEAYGDCLHPDYNGNGAAILHYNGYTGNSDFRPNTDVGDFPTDGVLLNPSSHHYTWNNTITRDMHRYDPRGGADEDFTNEEVGLRYYMMLWYQQNDNSYYGNGDLYDTTARWGLITPTINNLTMFRPSVPLGTQWDAAEKNFCNSSTVDTVNACNDNLCLCTHMLDIPLGTVVELFMVAKTGDPHEMHLHGYTFRVVGEGYLVSPDDQDAIGAIDFEEVKAMDRNGAIPRNLVNPWYKDTVTVQKGGYAIIRFKADNPGVWFFHCHNEGHLMQGMAMVMKVGDPEHFPEAPDYHPVCGGYNFYKEYPCDGGRGTSGCARNSVAILFVLLLLAAQKLFM